VDSRGVGSRQDLFELNTKWCILGTFKTKSIKEDVQLLKETQLEKIINLAK
jgi:hypothetical protein